MPSNIPERGTGKRNSRSAAKTNVLTYGIDLWERTFQEVASEYPDIKTDYDHVDACCMWMVKNPEFFDVIVTTNMFGDIITDLGGHDPGRHGRGRRRQHQPRRRLSMFEPIGGSAPKYTGMNKINPLAAIASVQMMFEYINEDGAAARVLEAIKKTITGDMKSMDAGKMGHGTKEVGDLVAGYIRSGS